LSRARAHTHTRRTRCGCIRHSRHDLGTDEAALKVGVDGSRRLRRLDTPLDLPALDLVLTSSEKVNQVDGLQPSVSKLLVNGLQPSRRRWLGEQEECMHKQHTPCLGPGTSWQCCMPPSFNCAQCS
jgi:hypothetical protein